MQAHLDVLDRLGMGRRTTYVGLARGPTWRPQKGEYRPEELCRTLPLPEDFISQDYPVPLMNFKNLMAETPPSELYL